MIYWDGFVCFFFFFSSIDFTRWIIFCFKGLGFYPFICTCMGRSLQDPSVSVCRCGIIMIHKLGKGFLGGQVVAYHNHLLYLKVSFHINGNLDDAASANILATLTVPFQIKEDYSQFDQGD
ncbi:uncharacterized protein LOC111302148 [Durio zibethinus]|uniref:Uncharacterized protein LOC111302148 n=1 Tax=Durio zibethinus TaxID=66656 RepID=A0A6P5ZMQ5_DURZI|nr:uncharacterized protein LOC111302148 [Durio zibethinus]